MSIAAGSPDLGIGNGLVAEGSVVGEPALLIWVYALGALGALLNIGANDSDRGLMLAVAIAAGFSERLLTNAIAAVVPGNGPG